MARFFMGQELIQGELPANSPKPPSTPPEGVIMTDIGQDGYTREYIYISMAGSAPEEIVISEGYPVEKKRISAAAVAVEEAPEPRMGGAVETMDGIILPEGAIMPDNAVFSGLPTGGPSMGSPAAAAPVASGIPVVGAIPQAQQPLRMGGAAAPASVPLVTIQKAAPKAPVMVQHQAAPTPGLEVQVPFVSKPVDRAPEILGNVPVANSIDSLRPVQAQSVADGPRMAQTERPVAMLGQARTLPLTSQESRKGDAYPVSNPIQPPQPMGMQISSPAHGQNQVPIRGLGQTAPAPAAAPAASTPPATTGKCPGAVEMPDGRTIEPEDNVSLKDLCELMPFLVQTLTDFQSKNTGPGSKIPLVGNQPVPGNPYGRPTGGWVGGGGGAPGPAGPRGPAGEAGPPGPGSIVEPPVVKVDGDFTAGPGSFVPVPGTSVPFSMSAAGVAEVKVLVTLGSGVTQECENVQLGIRVNGTDYPLTVRLIQTLVPNVDEFLIGQCFVFPIQLPQGSYTAELLLRGLMPGEFGAGLGTPAAVSANPSIPLIITVSHN